MKVSFDFDDTLQLPIIQKIAERHISAGDDVHIITTRHPKQNIKDPDIPYLATSTWISHLNKNEDLFRVAERLGIPKDNICFTKSQDKVHFLKTFDIHYDDDEYEIDLITRSELKCLGILVNYKNYNLGV